MNFWDTSAIVAMLADENAAPIARRIHEADDRMVVWWGTLVECAAAVASRERAKSLRPPRATEVLERVDQLAELWCEVQPDRRIRTLARRLLRVHPLRAGDALRLAAAVAFAEDNQAGVGFVSFDARLNAAAAREGFPILTEVAMGREAPPNSS